MIFVLYPKTNINFLFSYRCIFYDLICNNIYIYIYIYIIFLNNIIVRDPPTYHFFEF